MNPFPEDWELLSLFDGEPTVLDSGVPWFYNRITFTVDRPLGRVECSIGPADHALTFRCSTEEQTVIALQLDDVSGLSTWRQGKLEGFTATLEDPRRGELRIQISPDVSVAWCAPPA